MNPLEKALLFIFLLATLVLVHELGHYLAAKLFRVKVLTFSIGFGPKVLSFRWGETEYQIAALPLGGYVKMAGDDPTEPLPDADKGRGFLEQAAWKRALIAFAGPAMNLVFPILVYFIAFSMTGSDYAPLVASVYPDQPAYAAGLRPGDRITSIEGQPIRYFSELQEAVRPRAELKTSLTFQRGGKELTATLVPSRFEQQSILGTQVRGILGIGLTARAPLVAVPNASEQSDSPAARAGLKTFDRIVRIGERPIRSYPELAEALSRASGPVELTVARDTLVGGGAGALTTWDTFTTQLAPRPIDLDEGQEATAVGFESTFGIEPIDLYLFSVEEGSPAWEAGLRRGDKIVSLDGQPILSFATFDQLRAQKGEADLDIAFERAGERFERVVRQKKVKKLDEFKNEHELLAFGAIDDRRATSFAEIEKVPLKLSLGEAFVKAVRVLPQEIGQTLHGIWLLVSRKLSARNLGGPIAIYHVTIQSAEAGSDVFLRLMGFISINLGLLNLMPIPILDGFHILSAGIEGVRRRPLSDNTRIVLNLLGLLFLLLLMGLAFWNDIANFVLR
ncbi:MAG: RIP metalloprotease RseP [Myxococcales bacterium]|jgi:regulator of sigma E protease|nr:RIP metalloprotease RseP [Myxococcales bacterium]